MFVIMFLSIFLAIAVFAQCYPAQSLWDSDVKTQACPISLTTLAFVMCCESMPQNCPLRFMLIF